MIQQDHQLSLGKQTELLGFSRGMMYYEPHPLGQKDLNLMNEMDKLHLEYPFMGTRMLVQQLARQGFSVGRAHVRTLMQRMGIHAIYRKPRTSGQHPKHKKYPYLLRKKEIDINQVWALDTTYIPMEKGFVYLTAVIDWSSRTILAHKVAITLEACHAVEVLSEALSKYPAPEIVNTDQGSQFTADEFIYTVVNHGCKISMDGKGSWRDNVMIERFWKTIKYEEIYLKAYETVQVAKSAISGYINWYNTERRHSSLDNQTPNEAYGILAVNATKKAA